MLFLVCKIPLLARRTRPSAARDDRVSCIQCHVIPSELYKILYLTLFESHLSYGITAWGGICKNLLQPLFITQKKCIIVLFGDKVVYKIPYRRAPRLACRVRRASKGILHTSDKDAYMVKFKTCARTRLFENRCLGEPSKTIISQL